LSKNGVILIRTSGVWGMSKFRFLLLAVALLLLDAAAWALPRIPRVDDGPRVIPGRIIVRFKPGKQSKGLSIARAVAEGATARPLPQIGAAVLTLPRGHEAQTAS